MEMELIVKLDFNKDWAMLFMRAKENNHSKENWNKGMSIQQAYTNSKRAGVALISGEEEFKAKKFNEVKKI